MAPFQEKQFLPDLSHLYSNVTWADNDIKTVCSIRTIRVQPLVYKSLFKIMFRSIIIVKKKNKIFLQ